jgi:two-component system OmpR family response regulator
LIILLVDDDPEIRLIARVALGKIGGHTVLEAPDEQVAHSLTKDRRPDLILMDVVLGEIDGVAAAERLRAALGPVPLIFLTGRTQPAEMARLHAAGARGVVSKPFDPGSLSTAVERLLADGGA